MCSICVPLNKVIINVLFFSAVAFKEAAPAEPPKTEKAPAAADKSKAGKGGKGGKDKGKDKDGKGSRPPSQQFDLMKPHWTLRVVSDANAAVSIHVYASSGWRILYISGYNTCQNAVSVFEEILQ